MTSARKSYISESAEKNLNESYYHVSADSFIKHNIAYDRLKGLNFLDFRKILFRYYEFSVARIVFFVRFLGNGVCITRKG